ncbi:porin [Roseovarius indicus]|uniref:porin n=1 Tax=Roseovarius indicus TaxID=540747 RepID=UPI0032EB9EAA
MVTLQGAHARALTGVSALALLVPAGASAAEWEISVGGYMEQYLAFSSADIGGAPDRDGVDAAVGTEFYFRPSITLDNGLTFGADLNLEGSASTTGDADGGIDEAFVFVRGSFGEILIGEQELAGSRLTPRPPGAYFPGPDASILSINSGSIGNFIPFSGAVGGVETGDDVYRGTLGSSFASIAGGDNQPSITYFTPRFAGFQLGLSYARDSSSSLTGSSTYTDLRHIFDIGANYVNSFGDFDVAISARWGTAENRFDPRADPQLWGAGISVERGGFTIGGSWAESRGSSRARNDGVAYEVGISYETGPWTFAFTHFHGQNTDNEHIGFGPEERLETFQLGVSYDLNYGATRVESPFSLAWADKAEIFGSITAVNFDEDVGDPGFGTPGNDVDGFVIGTGFRLSF